MQLHIHIQYLLHPFTCNLTNHMNIFVGRSPSPKSSPHLVAKLQSRKVPSTLPDTKRSASQAALKQTTALQQTLGVGWVVGWKQS